MAGAETEMIWRWSNFTEDEMRCSHCGELKINEPFMDRLQALRKDFAHAMIITSGYRCPEYNAEISKTGLTGPHTTSRAIDVSVWGERCFLLLGAAIRHGFTGIGEKQHGPYKKRFMHLDDLYQTDKRPRPWVWTY